MDALAQIFDRFPALASCLEKVAWQRDFDSRTLDRSVSYATGTAIKSIRVKEVNKGQGVVIAEVLGSGRQTYQVIVHFYQQTEGDEMRLTLGYCSCPVGHACKHNAAVFRYLQKRAEKHASPAEANSNPQLDWKTKTWLEELQKAAAANFAKSPEAKPYNKFLAYFLEESHAADPTLTLRVGTKLKSGRTTLDDTTPNADLSRPPRYMTEEDLPLVSRYRAMERRGGYRYRGVGLDSPGAAALVKDLLATGRLVVAGSESARVVTPVTEGTSEKVRAAWKTLANGSTQPTLEFSREGLLFAASEPPFYLDFERALLGPLESDLPGNLLRLWEKGPAVAPAAAITLGDRLRSLPGKPVPGPVELEEEIRPAEKPVGLLTVERGKVSGQEGVLAFPALRYGDGPEFAFGEKGVQSHSEIVGRKRIIRPRDPKAETRLMEALESAGFHSLTTRISPHFLGQKMRQALILSDHDFGDLDPWLDLLNGPKAEKLREAGWEINAAPDLRVHDVADFFAEIESDPDHGIDWFRFDVSGELDGKKFSLIPAIAQAIEDGILETDPEDPPDTVLVPCENPDDGFIRFPGERFREICEQVAHLFQGRTEGGEVKLDRLAAADLADSLAIDSSETTRALAALGRALKNITELPVAKIPKGIKADLRAYQAEGFSWLQFLAAHQLHGILADDMGLGKTIQTLAHLTAEVAKKPGLPSLVLAPTSVVPNWAAEAEKFSPKLKVLVLQGLDRSALFKKIPKADLVLTSYPLLNRDIETLSAQDWHCVILDEAQYIKNPNAQVARHACKLKAAHRLCLSGTPMENHLGELWSLMRFTMPGFLGDEKSFNSRLRRPIERDRSRDAQLALNRRVSPLILRRTKDQVATELPDKTVIVHHITLTKKQTDLYESVRAAMDKRVRDAISARGLAKSHIIVLDALLKLRQICCHPQLLKVEAAKKVTESAKLDFLTEELLPTLLEEGRRILLFSQFTSMLALIEAHLEKKKIPFLKLTGQTKDRGELVKKFQTGEVPVFLISLKAGGTGLNLTAADTVIHYDPWWNPAAENQATDRAHRIGQMKPVFVHKLACAGTIEDRILDLQKHKSALVEALLSEETSKLRIDSETLSHLLSPLE